MNEIVAELAARWAVSGPPTGPWAARPKWSRGVRHGPVRRFPGPVNWSAARGTGAPEAQWPVPDEGQLQATERRDEQDDSQGRRLHRARAGACRGAPRTVGGSRAFALLLVITGAAGLLAAWVITIDKFKLLEAKVAGKTSRPGCSLNPVVSCGSVMESEQAAAFGFPNPMLGLVAYGIVICVGMSLLGRRPLPALVLADLQRGHALRRRLLHLAAVPVAVPDQRAVPVVLPGLGRDDHHVLVRDLVQRPQRLPARARAG